MLSPPLIDSHCHLDFDCFDKDREDVLKRATDNNITHIIIPGTQQKYWQRITTLCTHHPQLLPCYGLHPYWIGQQNKSDLDALKEYINSNKTVAIGECGLDFRAQQAEKNLQLYYFEAQLKIAETLQLPVIIHSVNATEQTIQSIKKHGKLRGMIHSYSGSLEQAKQLIDLNFYISFSGSITYDNAKKIRTVAKEIPLNSILVETDAPDQADKQNKGLRNEPAFLCNTIEVLAELRDETVNQIALQTSSNAKHLFGI